MLERLPTPWGLVRSGVAPDHPKIKSVSRIYEKTAAHPRFRFFGNVTFGEHVSREDLLAHYHAIVYATGSPADRPLGHPRRRPPRLARRYRVRRLVQRPPRQHRPRDRPALGRARRRDRQRQRRPRRRPHARARSGRARPDRHRRPRARRCSLAAAYQRSSILGRRGPAQAAFTNPELLRARRARRRRRHRRGRRTRPLRSRSPILHAEEDITAPAQRRDPALLRRATPPPGHPKRIVLRFLLSPAAFLPGEPGHLGAVELDSQRAGAGRRRPPACPGNQRARDDPRRPRLPRDRLPRHPPPRRPLRRALGHHPQRRGRVLDPATGISAAAASTSSAGSSAAPPA